MGARRMRAPLFSPNTNHLHVDVRNVSGRSLYPTVDRKVRLHWQPTGLLAKVPPLEGLQPEVYELNMAAAELLLLCNGETGYAELLQRISGLLQHKMARPVDTAGELFLELAKKRIIVFHDAPEPVAVVIGGSKEHFSPSHFAIELTSECNLKCLHCYRGCEPGTGVRLPTGKLLSIIRSMADHGVTSVELTGGEPTIHPDFFAVLDLCCSSFHNVAVLSNGWRIDDAFAARMAERPRPPFVQVDLDGSDASTHDGLRGVSGSFDNALRAIRALKKYGIRVRAAMNIHKGNYHQMDSTLDLARSVGADWFAVSPLMMVGNGRYMEPLAAEEYAGLSATADRFAEEHPRFFFLSKELESRINGSIDNCGAGSRAMVLGPGGVVRPCLLLDERHLSLGNLAETDYASFIASAGAERFYRIHAPNPQVCEGCEQLSFCLGCFVGPVQMAVLAKERGTALQCVWSERYSMFGELIAAGR